MTTANPRTVWDRLVRTPQKLWLRKALFQVHLWSGIAVGLYILLMSVTGSVLVYWNELYRAATPETEMSHGSGPPLTDAQLTDAAVRMFPSYLVTDIERSANPDEEVSVWLRHGGEIRKRRFDSRTGADLGDSFSPGMRVMTDLRDLHDNLLAGEKGLKVNAAGAILVLLLAVTGLAIWWPGMKTWRRSLTLPRGVGFQRTVWHLHSMVGFWTFGAVILFGLTGVFLSDQQPFLDLADWLQPPTPANAGRRIVDKIAYWLAYLHFGRINGIGIPCRGPGLCDQATKATWAIFGLIPAVMFVTGAIMWWNRVVSPWARTHNRRGSKASSVS